MMILCFVTFNEEEGVLTSFYNAPTGGIGVNSFAFLGLCWLLNKIEAYILSSGNGAVQTIIQLLLSVFFCTFSLLSIYFENNTAENLETLLVSGFSFLSIGFSFIGGTILFYIIIHFIWNISIDINESNTGCARFFGKHLYRNCIFVISVFWLPQYIARFPGIITFDSWHAIAMYFDYAETTSQHPLMWALLIGKLSELGLKIGIGWLAPLVICFVQHILAVLVVTYTVAFIKKMGLSYKFMLAVLAFYMVLPPMYLYASTVYNDFIYSLCIQLLTIELAYYLFKRKSYFSEFHHILLTMLAVFGTHLRYNGFYTMLVVIAVISAREIYLIINSNTKVVQSISIVLFMVIPILCGQTIQNTLNAKYVDNPEKKYSSRAMLAMPIQQTVRCLIEHGDNIRKEDYEAIHTVLTWSDEEYAEAYNPRNFDAVKNSFKIDASREELTNFMKAWTNLIVNYPLTCFMATANQTYYLFSPLVENTRYYKGLSNHTGDPQERYEFDASQFVIEFPILSSLNQFVYAFHKHYYHALPFVGLISGQATYSLLLFAICLRLLFNRNRKALFLTVSLLVTQAITIIGPAVYNHPRYTYPIIFSMPVLFVAYALTNRPRKKSLQR